MIQVEAKAQVYCRDCGTCYEQMKAPGEPWPPWCCGLCGAQNIHVARFPPTKPLLSDPVSPLAFICPWCGLAMPRDDRDPVLERCCGLCATFSLGERKKRNPGFGKLYEAALLYDLVEEAWDLDPNPDLTDSLEEDPGVGLVGSDGAGLVCGGPVAGGSGDFPVYPTRSFFQRFRAGQMTYSVVLLVASLALLAFALHRHLSARQAPPPKPMPRVVQLSELTLFDLTPPAIVDDDSPTESYVRRKGRTFFGLEIPYSPYRADKRLPRSSPAAAYAITIEATPRKRGKTNG